MNTRKKEFFRSPMARKGPIPVALMVMLSCCLFGCHTPSGQRNQTGGAEAARAPGSDSSMPLPKVILIGDSIMGGYSPTVQRQLNGLAEIKGLSRTTSSNVLARLDEVIAAQPDVIHLN